MCTARIGQSPADSVVNHELRVHGIAGLRIVDASVRQFTFIRIFLWLPLTMYTYRFSRHRSRVIPVPLSWLSRKKLLIW